MPGSEPGDSEIGTALKDFSHKVETMTSQCEKCGVKEAWCVGLEIGGAPLSGKVSQSC